MSNRTVGVFLDQDCLFAIGTIGATEVVAFIPMNVPSLVYCWTKIDGEEGLTGVQLAERVAEACRGLDSSGARRALLWFDGWNRWYGIPRPLLGDNFGPWLSSFLPRAQLLFQAQRSAADSPRWLNLRGE